MDAAFGISLMDLEPSMCEVLEELIEAERTEQNIELREAAGDVYAYLFLHSSGGLRYALQIRASDIPPGDQPLHIRICLEIQKIVERDRPISLGIGWPVLESDTKGAVCFVCRNIWGESSIQVFAIDRDQGVHFEPTPINNVATRYLEEFVKLYMAWSGLSQVRDLLPGIEQWAHECIDADDEDPCPCGSDLEYGECCSRYEFNSTIYPLG